MNREDRRRARIESEYEESVFEIEREIVAQEARIKNASIKLASLRAELYQLQNSELSKMEIRTAVIKEMRSEGMTRCSIALALGVEVRTVYRHIKIAESE